MHYILGTGPVGSAVATQLMESGAEVRLINRSGRNPGLGCDVLALDIANPDALAAATRGADVIYNCVNPPHYHRWQTEWPPLADSILSAAIANGSVLATTGNLYPYGDTQDTITSKRPERPVGTKGHIRARMWADALAAHRAGKVRALEVRSADYLSFAGVTSIISQGLRAATAGSRAYILGNPDAEHSWAYIPDVARTLIAAAADPEAPGQIWFTPPASNKSQRTVLEDVARASGHARVKISKIPQSLMTVLGAFQPTIREMGETACERNDRFVIDGSHTTAKLGIEATPWEKAVTELVATQGK